MRFAPQEVTGSNGQAAARLTLTGRHVGEWMGVAPTGREFEIAMREMHHFADGRITQHQRIMRCLGVVSDSQLSL